MEPDLLEKAEIAEFAQAQWVDLCAKLGERVGVFIEAAWNNAMAYELREPGCAARFVNLCCALGPSFDRKPDNEWALAILADERLGQWVKLHQLVVRAAVELRARAQDGARIGAQLLVSDAALLDRLDRQQTAQRGEVFAAARLSCDLEAVELRVLETEWRREYHKVEGLWKLMPLPAATLALRISSRDAIPPGISVLTQPAGAKVAARLQARSLKHSLCSQARHPELTYAGAHGLSSWSGHNATATSWQVHCDPPPPLANAPLQSLLEETMPQPSLLRISTCGVRDEGVPFGTLDTFVFAYPSHQWLSIFHRDSGPQLQWPRQEAQAGLPLRTRCHLERDGVPAPAKKWVAAFHEGLDSRVQGGFDQLFTAWTESAGDASMALTADLLVGKADLAWGWQESPAGLASHPVTRLLVDFDLANRIECVLAGEIALGATRTRVRLILEGKGEMKHRFEQKVLRGALPEVLLPTAGRWRAPFRVEFDPIAMEGGAMWSDVVSCTGSMVAECGLRPRIAGGGGWQWYARLACESVFAHVRVHDPLLGQTSQTIQLLPALNLLDWSSG